MTATKNTVLPRASPMGSAAAIYRPRLEVGTASARMPKRSRYAACICPPSQPTIDHSTGTDSGTSQAACRVKKVRRTASTTPAPVNSPRASSRTPARSCPGSVPRPSSAPKPARAVVPATADTHWNPRPRVRVSFSVRPSGSAPAGLSSRGSSFQVPSAQTTYIPQTIARSRPAAAAHSHTRRTRRSCGVS
ncbi:hypothetical protein [Streptomyces sp. P17]|uniref:hypothetical protein n=1 Tax=Streptomyces sp. P17 TaxID=3074716 RepID=UPI0028F451DF|nr:hypothetical protein [Streptomyces sp. P17]MDT9701237.1 hypothetical protein [Streptomyces sp. P17]